MSIVKIEPFITDNLANFTFAGLTITANAILGNANLGNSATANFLSVNSNITSGNANLGNAVIGNYFIGNGYYLTGVTASPGSSILNGNSNVSVGANSNVSVSVNGVSNVAVFATGGIYANAIHSNFYGDGGNITGTVPNANYAAYAGNVVGASQSNITSLGLLTGLSVSGYSSFIGNANVVGNINLNGTGGAYLGNSVTSNYFVGNGAYITGIGAPNAIYSGTSNLYAITNGNIVANIGGNNTLVITGTGVNVAGYANVTGNVTANYFIGNGSYITGISTTTQLVNGNSNIVVDSNSYIQISANGVANVFTLGDGFANVLGNLNVNGRSNLGPIGNVKITGGSANYVMVTNGSGDLSWAPAATIYSNTFTGTGTDTQFGPLPVTPSSINQTIINYNGVIQLRSSYTLSGANIIFSSPPALGALIEVTTTGVTAVVTGGGGSGSTSSISNGNSNVVVNAGGSIVISANAVYGVATFLDTGSNITSNLTLANVAVTGTTNLGSNANVKITGGTTGQSLTTDGTGNLSWATITGGGSSGTLYSDVFTGTGLQTSFGPLSATPSSVNQTWINYNGVLQLRSSYTLSGANIVFTSPPAYGSSIEVTTITAGTINVSTSQTARAMVLGILFGG